MALVTQPLAKGLSVWDHKGCIQALLKPIEAPAEMGAGCPARFADCADHIAFGPEFPSDLGEHLQIDFGPEYLYLPGDVSAGAAKPNWTALRSNLRSVLRLVADCEETLPISKRTLWSDSGEDLADRIEEALNSEEVL